MTAYRSNGGDHRATAAGESEATPETTSVATSRDDSHAVGPLASPGFWLLQAAQRWKVEFNRGAAEIGLTHTQFQILASTGWLEHLGQHPTQQEVADQAGTDRMMTSKVVAALERRGLLERATSGREKRLRLTAQGRDLTDRAAALARDVDRALFPDLAVRDLFREVAQAGVPERDGQAGRRA